MRAVLALLLLSAACMASAYKITLNSGWVTPDIGNMEPLACPAGFRPARDADHALLVAFLDAEFNRAQRSGEIEEQLTKYHCARGVDAASKSYSRVNGCVSLAPNAGWASAEGVLSYKCSGAPSGAAPLRLGVEGDGQYA